ncbi:MAG: lipase family protein, partial [Fusobacteriaceae bacterium]
MRLSEREFLITSMLAYLNFEKKHIGRELLEILGSKDIKLDENETMKILKAENLEITLDFFREDLEGWKIFHIENRRALSKSIFNRNDKTGFYSVSFQKDDKVIVAYRGSETYPIEEAYKDFVENNFALGIGKRPKQFNDAAYVIDYHVKELGIKIKNMAITGHSLGGGLAQFAALYCHKAHGEIPFTSTWNAVGINRGGVIQMQDFIDFDEILLKKLDCSKKMVEILRPIRDEYINMLNNYDVDAKEEFISLLEKNSRVEMIIEGLI